MHTHHSFTLAQLVEPFVPRTHVRAAAVPLAARNRRGRTTPRHGRRSVAPASGAPGGCPRNRGIRTSRQGRLQPSTQRDATAEQAAAARPPASRLYDPTSVVPGPSSRGPRVASLLSAPLLWWRRADVLRHHTAPRVGIEPTSLILIQSQAAPASRATGERPGPRPGSAGNQHRARPPAMPRRAPYPGGSDRTRLGQIGRAALRQLT